MSVGDTPASRAEQLALLIHRRLLGRVRVRGLRVEVREQGLILYGQTQTYHAKQLAQHAAMAATDLPILANQIEVR